MANNQRTRRSAQNAQAAQEIARFHDCDSLGADTYHGQLVKLVPDVQVVQVLERETTDAGMQGEMTVTLTLTDADQGGTNLPGSRGVWRIAAATSLKLILY